MNPELLGRLVTYARHLVGVNGAQMAPTTATAIWRDIAEAQADIQRATQPATPAPEKTDGQS
jgi:hypothetical protein